MRILEWIHSRRQLRAEAQDEAIYMLRDHGEAADLAIEHELSNVPTLCSRHAILKLARVTQLRRQRQSKRR